MQVSETNDRAAGTRTPTSVVSNPNAAIPNPRSDIRNPMTGPEFAAEGTPLHRYAAFMAYRFSEAATAYHEASELRAFARLASFLAVLAERKRAHAQRILEAVPVPGMSVDMPRRRQPHVSYVLQVGSQAGGDEQAAFAIILQREERALQMCRAFVDTQSDRAAKLLLAEACRMLATDVALVRDSTDSGMAAAG